MLPNKGSSINNIMLAFFMCFLNAGEKTHFKNCIHFTTNCFGCEMHFWLCGFYMFFTSQNCGNSR